MAGPGDLEEELQKRLSKKRGLLKLYRDGHPGESLGETRYKVDKFVQKPKEVKEVDRENWQRAFSQETGGCSTGSSPVYERIAPSVIRGKYERPVVTGITKPVPETDLERLQREVQELKKLVFELTKENKELRKRLGD